MNKNILFRADSSSSIGTGHIMRGLVLAKQYPDSHIIFTTQLLDGNFNSHVVQDDTHERHYCDILLNHNISGDKKIYKGLVPKNCELRCGSKYILIRDEFIKEKRKKTISLSVGGDDAKTIWTTREVNTYKTEWAINKIKNAALKFKNENGRKTKVDCMGLAFKPDIDDLRESLALLITKRLIVGELDVFVAEPNINSFKEFKVLKMKTNLYFCGVSNR